LNYPQQAGRWYLLVWTTLHGRSRKYRVAVDEQDYALVKATKAINSGFSKFGGKFLKGGYRAIIRLLKEGVGWTSLRWTLRHNTAVKKIAEENPEKFHTVIATDTLIMPISNTEGTGLVHTAVSAGTEDFALGRKYGLPMIPIIADNADYLPGLDWLSGQNAKNIRILDHWWKGKCR
jgi:isoleucyl-tRNA synthetase